MRFARLWSRRIEGWADRELWWVRRPRWPLQCITCQCNQCRRLWTSVPEVIDMVAGQLDEGEVIVLSSQKSVHMDGRCFTCLVPRYSHQFYLMRGTSNN